MEPFVLGEPRFVDEAAIVVAGLSGNYTRETSVDIPMQWNRFNTQLDAAGLGLSATLGVVYPTAVMRYVSGVKLPEGMARPEDWIEVTVPAQRYAVFAAKGGLPAIRAAWMAIFSEWVPKAQAKVTDGPMMEMYDSDWVQTGAFEIWVPVA